MNFFKFMIKILKLRFNNRNLVHVAGSAYAGKDKVNTVMEWFEWISDPRRVLVEVSGFPSVFISAVLFGSVRAYGFFIKWVNGAWLFSIDLGIYGEEHLNRHAAHGSRNR